MKGAAMHRAFLLFKKSGEALTASPQRVKKSGCPGLFRQRLKYLRRGRKTPRPAKPGDTISFWRAVALQTSPNGFLTACGEAYPPPMCVLRNLRHYASS